MFTSNVRVDVDCRGFQAFVVQKVLELESIKDSRVVQVVGATLPKIVELHVASAFGLVLLHK